MSYSLSQDALYCIPCLLFTDTSSRGELKRANQGHAFACTGFSNWKKQYEAVANHESSADHPVILFNDIPVKKVNEHKHLGIILDSKLSFSAHIKAAISKMRKGIGLLKYLSKYLPRHTLNELYKLYVRPHLDYGDVIYHIPPKVCEFSQNIALSNLMDKVESVQYSAALAVSGTWRGTSREKLYAELGWESLSSRRWSRRLTLFYK